MVNIYLTIWVAQFILFRSLRPKGAAFPAQQHSATCYIFGGGQEYCCSRGTHLGDACRAVTPLSLAPLPQNNTLAYSSP